MTGMNITKWLVGDAVALDELGNAVILDGNAHSTISANCGSQILANRPCLFCRIVCGVLGRIWPYHCTDSWLAEKAMLTAAVGLPGEK